MNEEQIELLINRYLKMFPARGIDEKTMDYLEKRLGLVFPNDFKMISRVFDGYEEIAHQSFFSFDPNVKDWNIASQTEFYRNSDCNLPRKYVALREEGESFIVMETQPSNTLETPVIWCSTMDAYNLDDKSSLKDNPIIFSSFGAFFEFLLCEEEVIRGTLS